jgi:hypothetical protein
MAIEPAKGNTQRDPETYAELRQRLLRDPAGAVDIRPSEADLKAMGLPADWCRPTTETTLEQFVAGFNRHPGLAVELLCACFRAVLNALDQDGDS